MKQALLGAVLGGSLLLPAGAFAQVGAAFYAPPDAMDQMSGASTGAGGAGNYIGRAQGAAGQANANQQNPFGPQGANQQNPFGAQGANQQNPFGAQGANQQNPFGAQPGQGFGQQQQQQQQPAEPAKLTAWGGERIVGVRTGQILKDARELSILATASGNYYDDGERGHDAVANDNIYTNITINDDEFISPESHYVKTRIIQTLKFVSPPPDGVVEGENVEQGLLRDLQGIVSRTDASLRTYLFEPRESERMDFFANLTPMEFSQVRVASTNPFSGLPHLMDLEREQDRKLREWGENFLREYRINPDEFASPFYKTFLPPPPRAPRVPMPANFYPHEIDEDEEGAGRGFGGAGFEGSTAGAPIGNASSRYF